MARRPLRGLDRRALVDHLITGFSLFIKERCSEAELEISFARYEEEDGHIRVFPPDSLSETERERLREEIAEKSLDILIEDGVLILAAIYEPHQRGKW